MIPVQPFSLQMSEAQRAQQMRVGGTDLRFTGQDLLNLLHGPADLHAWNDAKRWTPGLADFDSMCVRRFCLSLLPVDGDAVFCYTDGSFVPGTTMSPPMMGWACCFFDPPTQSFAWAAGRIDQSLCSLGAVPSAFISECAALGAAALISATVLPTRRVIFMSDCSAAIAVLHGPATAPSEGPPSLACRAYALRCQIAGDNQKLEHVAGHQGVVGNEIADRLSKQAARSKKVSYGLCRHRRVAEFWFETNTFLLPWAGLCVKSLLGDASVPPVGCCNLGHDRDHAGLSAADLLKPFLPPGSLESEAARNAELASDPTTKVHHMQFCVISFNALSLAPGKDTADRAAPPGIGLAYQTGASAILARQLFLQGAAIAMIQESRCPAGTIQTGKYTRFCSGAVRGQWGTEIWILDGHALLQGDHDHQSTCHLQASRVTMLFADPRRLFVRVSCHPICMLLVSLHGPHSACEAGFLDAWWEETIRLLRHHHKGETLIVAGDFNASLGSHPTQAVGTLAPEAEDKAGEYVQQLAATFDLILPSTFESWHTGPSFTYYQKKSAKVKRYDYVMVPAAWCRSSLQSYTAPKVHAGHSTKDHVAICLDVQVWLGKLAVQPRYPKRAIFASDVCNPHNAPIVRQVLQSAPAVAWHVSSHAHAAIITRHVQDGLQAAFPSKKRRPRHPYLSAQAWELQQTVAKVRHALHHRRARLDNQRKLAVFHVWKHPAQTYHDVFIANLWVGQALALQEIQAHHLASLSKALKAVCKRDRDSYVHSLAEQIDKGPANGVFEALHRLLHHRRKKPYQMDPLPSLRRSDGQPCTDANEMMEVWRRHFGNLEAGLETSFTALANQAHACAHLGESMLDMPHPKHITHVASLPDLQQILRATKVNKAAGMDSLPPELCKFFASELACILHPLYLKTAFRGHEPAGWKGGAAVQFYKQRGRQDDCSSYRTVLLLCSWAKATHKCLRTPLKTHFECNTPPLQMGGKSGCSVIFGAHLVRTVHRLAIAANSSCYTIYADIASAFYSAVTTLVAGQEGCTDADRLRNLTDKLNITEDELAELRDHLAEPTAMTSSQADPWLQQVTAQDVFRQLVPDERRQCPCFHPSRN